MPKACPVLLFYLERHQSNLPPEILCLGEKCQAWVVSNTYQGCAIHAIAMTLIELGSLRFPNKFPRC